jgi:transposase InsO family protein
MRSGPRTGRGYIDLAGICFRIVDQLGDGFNRKCGSKPARVGVDCRPIWVSARSPPSLPTCSTAPIVAPAPNRKWIADFTYVWTAEGWLYVAAVIDLFSRRAVGWSMSAAMTAQLVTDALVMAIRRRGKPDALLHHSDRGSQYTSVRFAPKATELLRRREMTRWAKTGH